MLKKLITLHLTLIRYILKDYQKKRTIKEFVIWGKNVIVGYVKCLLNEYKQLFRELDPTYQKQKQKHDKYQQLKQDLQRALKILRYVDEKMGKQGVNRQKRRQFWRDFYRDGQLRTDVFDDLTKEVI